MLLTGKCVSKEMLHDKNSQARMHIISDSSFLQVVEGLSFLPLVYRQAHCIQPLLSKSAP